MSGEIQQAVVQCVKSVRRVKQCT